MISEHMEDAYRYAFIREEVIKMPPYKKVLRIIAGISMMLGIFVCVGTKAENIMQQIYVAVDMIMYFVFACALLLF